MSLVHGSTTEPDAGRVHWRPCIRYDAIHDVHLQVLLHRSFGPAAIALLRALEKWGVQAGRGGGREGR
jgi:hypothetical protein